MQFEDFTIETILFFRLQLQREKRELHKNGVHVIVITQGSEFDDLKVKIEIYTDLCLQYFLLSRLTTKKVHLHPTFPSLHLRHKSFSNPSVASPTSRFIFQPFFRFSYVISSSLNSPGEPPMERTIMAGEHTWYLQDPYRYHMRRIR